MLDINAIEYEDVALAVNAMEKLLENNPGLLCDGDIHAYTKLLGDLCREVFFILDDKYKISDLANKDFENTCQQILDLATTVMGKNQDTAAIIAKVLNTIRISNGTIESETGLNVIDLLIRTWSVTNNLLVSPEEKHIIITNITDNILTNGGCLAGVSGRLIHIYCSNIRTILEKAKIEKEEAINLQQIEVESSDSDEDRRTKRRRTEKPLLFGGSSTVNALVPFSEEEEKHHLDLALSASLSGCYKK